MLALHVSDGLGGVKVQDVGNQGYSSSPELAFLCKESRTADISSRLRSGRRISSTRRRPRGLKPQILKMAINESGNASFDGGQFLLKSSFSLLE